MACYKCGKKGHFIKECRSKMPISNHTSEESYRQKYKSLLATLIEEEETKSSASVGLVAECNDWVDSDDSSDDEEEVANLCLMASADQSHLNKDKIATSEWVNITMRKVHLFGSTSNSDEKLDIFDSLSCDMHFIENHKADITKQLESSLAELNLCKNELNQLKDVELKLKDQLYINSLITKENESFKEENVKLKTIIESWSRNAKLAQQCISEQIPKQVQAVLGGDFGTAALIPSICQLNRIADDSASQKKGDQFVKSFVKAKTSFESEMLSNTSKTTAAECDSELAISVAEKALADSATPSAVDVETATPLKSNRRKKKRIFKKKVSNQTLSPEGESSQTLQLAKKLKSLTQQVKNLSLKVKQNDPSAESKPKPKRKTVDIPMRGIHVSQMKPQSIKKTSSTSADNSGQRPIFGWVPKKN